MAAHWTQQVAKSLSTGRDSPAIETHLDALLLWLSNPEHPRVGDLDRAIGRRHLSRQEAARRAFRILDGLLFDRPEGRVNLRLGLPDDADPAHIKGRYRRLVQVYHPDRHPERTKWATRRTDLLNRAFDSHRKGAAQGAARAAARSGPTPRPGARWSKGLAALGKWLDRRLPGELRSLPERIRGLSRARQGLLVGVLGCLAVLIIAIGLQPEETPSRPTPRIIHHPLGEAPKQSATAAAEQRHDQADTEPQRARTTTAAEQTEEPDHKVSTDAKAEPAISQAPQPDDRQDRASRIAPPAGQEETKGKVEKKPSQTRQPAPEIASPAEEEPSETIGHASAPDQHANRAADTPESASSPQEEPQPSAAQGIDARSLARSAEPPRSGSATSMPRAPRLSIPPAEPPTPPEPPAAPDLPLQISAAAIATPDVPAVTTAPGDCGTVPELLRHFQRNYQAGTLDRFMALYSPHAKENDLANWFAIRQTYLDWFRKTSARRIAFEQLQFEPTAKGDRCAAIALFQVSYLDAQSLLVTKAGVIQLLLEHDDGGGLRILRLRY
ncbi:DnaJ domain-containing protein [Thiorhodococcus minor]|uniref:DnaJ domain-containing protein n=1 Tax=Thiorhodococcus minor TaxID=57489 RepID=A0A6M0JXP0_9GAMM|nr:DnaJ domain-containing protein [Thiorhodococcus minor]NEV61804.1 DnaJ domain-containing protein [Thiorhodococcus minor]